jgi:hypothetical protein
MSKDVVDKSPDRSIYLARYWFTVYAGKIGSPVRGFIINRVPHAGGTVAPLVQINASVAYGCALAHSPQTTREVRATFYSRLSQYCPHAVTCTFGRERPCPHGPGGGPPALHARFPSVPTTGGGDLTGDLSIPHCGVRSRGGFDL